MSLPAPEAWNSAVEHSLANPTHILGPYEDAEGVIHMSCDGSGDPNEPSNCDFTTEPRLTEVEVPTLRLFSDGLLSKWGFGDGDAPDVWLDWCDEQGIDYSSLRGWRGYILPELVRRYLAPVLEQKVELVDIGTNHNPIRAETVDGADVSDRWYDSQDTMRLTPEYIEVTMEQILEVAQEADRA